uniref:Uncharacterized protein n=1 Tax=Romanomermis culicivorax TaxID=13658 RepID=A0A915K693_ROMCU
MYFHKAPVYVQTHMEELIQPMDLGRPWNRGNNVYENNRNFDNPGGFADIDFGKGHIQLANEEKEIISEKLFDDAQIPPRLPIPNNPVVLEEVQIMEESQDEEVPELESDDEEGQVMRITEMDEETFIWTKWGTYIPPNTTTFVQAVVWP